MGLDGVLLVVFIVLKLCGVIAWPWIWVLSPLWIGLLLYIAVCLWSSASERSYRRKWR